MRVRTNLRQAVRSESVLSLAIQRIERMIDRGMSTVNFYREKRGKGETFQVEEGLQTFREEVHPGSATLDERFSSV